MSDEMVDNFVWILLQTSQQLKYPALMHLKFKFTNCIKVSPELIEVLPTITHLSFRSCNKAIHVLEIISKFKSDWEGIFAWLKLQALMITPFDLEWISPFCDFITTQISIGLPLKGISLSETDMEMLKSNEFLRNNVLIQMMGCDI